MKKTLGYILFVLSFVVWGIITLLPSINLTATEIASYTTILVVLGEVFFWVSTILLGKEIIDKIKNFFKGVFKKNKNS